MAGGGDYEKYRREYSKFDVDVDLDGTAVTATALKTPKSANHQIFVQRVVVSILTHVDGKILTIQDDESTPVLIAQFLDDAENDTTSGHTSDVWTADFGPEGTPITKGADLDYVANTGGSGFTARLHVAGYEKLIGPVTVAQAAAGG